MKLLSELSPDQLRTVADLQEQIVALRKEVALLLGVEVSAVAPAKSTSAPASKPGKKISVQARARRAPAQRARRARERKGLAQPTAAKPAPAPATAEPAIAPQEKPVSEAQLKALAKARKARWAKTKTVKPKQPKTKPAADEVPF